MVPRRLLHVDDDPSITALVAACLRSHGCETTSLHDPREVMRALPRLQTRVVVLDIDMPHIGGLELLERIKEYDGAVQVIMLTGLVTMDTALQSLRLGAEACCFKPIMNIEPLLTAVEACFQKLERWWQTLDDLTTRARAESGRTGRRLCGVRS